MMPAVMPRLALAYGIHSNAEVPRQSAAVALMVSGSQEGERLFEDIFHLVRIGREVKPRLTTESTDDAEAGRREILRQPTDRST